MGEARPLPLGGHPQTESSVGDTAAGGTALELAGKSPVMSMVGQSWLLLLGDCPCSSVPQSPRLVGRGWEQIPGGALNKGS